MKIPINWLKEYTKVPENLSLLTDKLTMAGFMLDKTEKIGQDTVIDLEIRGNRADAYSVLGIAREVCALFGTSLKEPKLHGKLRKAAQLKECRIEVKSPYVKRVMAIPIKNVKLGPSPKWMQERLTAYGIPAINNIVDATNYVMLETGQPMHAFDLGLIGETIEVRLAKKGEKLVTFEGTVLNLTSDDLIFANTKTPLSIAGAIGGRENSIQEQTKEVLLEAASYDRANIRRTSRRLSLFTDAALRHEKELDPNLVEVGIYRFLQLVKENNWGEASNVVFDHYPEIRKPLSINLSFDNFEKLSGIKIDRGTIRKILTSLQFEIKKETETGMTVISPTYRTDVNEEADLIEEVLRIYGYDKIPTNILSLEIPPVTTPKPILQEQNVKDAMISLGFDEIISLAFVREKLQSVNRLLGSATETKPVLISNPPSPDFKQMRQSLLPNLLDFTKKIIDERGEQARLFEIGKIYFVNKKRYVEERKLGIIQWEKGQLDFLDHKGYLESLIKILNLPEINFTESTLEVFGQPQYQMFYGKKLVGIGGKLAENTYYSEIDLDAILDLHQPAKATLWPKYPPVIEDFSFVVPERTAIGEVIKHLQSLDKTISKIELMDTYKDVRTLRVIYSDPEKTLSDSHIKMIREKIVKEAADKFQARFK